MLFLFKFENSTEKRVLFSVASMVPMFFFIILIIWSLKAGIEVLGKWSEFFIWIVFIIFLTIFVLCLSQMNISRLKPILNNGVTPLLKGAFSSFSYPFGETVVFTMVFSNISKVKSYKKIFIVGLLIGGGLIFFATLGDILVLGSNTISRVYFPTPMVTTLINLGDFLQRLELTVVIQFLVCVFVKISICTFAVCNGISKFFGFDDYKFIATPVALLMLAFSFFVYKSTMEMSSWTVDIWPYYSFSFEVIIPLVVFILAEFKNKNSKFTV
ncbi:GerAB/ArcD/ProY family transporter [Clostridium estertheticum]|uniref:Endospore germination permease n=1 Tax=Clostridium estertheticum TaxID=238834 RepID=A0AA47I3V5_9CLOT|nr:endospore germination permease [Clostridium estertheticum]WAG58537.1 endospore germination permease [Clostridium estertheticum]